MGVLCLGRKGCTLQNGKARMLAISHFLLHTHTHINTYLDTHTHTYTYVYIKDCHISHLMNEPRRPGSKYTACYGVFLFYISFSFYRYKTIYVICVYSTFFHQVLSNTPKKKVNNNSD